MKILFIAGVLAVGAAIATASAAEPTKRVFITPAEAQARMASDLAQWRKNLAPGVPHIAFTADSWRELRQTYAAAKGRQKEYFDSVIQRAQTLATKPAIAYRPPEEFVSPSLSLPSAKAELWQRDVGDNLTVSSMALALKDDPAIRKNIRDVVLTACEYPNWGLRSTGMHLASAHLSIGVAIAYDWHAGIWTDAEKEIIRKTIRNHVGDIAAGLYGKAFWAGDYFTNHNHVSVAALGLCGLAFLDDIPEAAEWLAAATLNFERAMSAANADGSTPEGFTYWSYSLGMIVRYIEGTRHVTGSDALYRKPFLKNTINYRLHGTTPGLGRLLPWGDVWTKATASTYSLFALAREYRSTEGQFLASSSPSKNMWSTLWYDPTLPATPPATLDYHATVVDLAASRTGWTPDDYLLSIKSGLNVRHHSHLDAGALALAFGDDWLLTAPGYGTGKADGTNGFWDRKGRRWTYFSTATESKSTLLIDGKNQRFDADARGTIDQFISTPAWCWTGVDLTQAYQDVDYVRRGILHRRGDYILVLDNAKAARSVIVEWLAQTLPAGTRFNPATPDRINVSGKTGSLEIRALFPAGLSFAPRKPTALHYDLPPDRVTTHALKTQGNNIRYATLLLPAATGKTNPVRNIAVNETTNGLTLIITGDGWTDTIETTADVRHLRATRTDEPTFTTVTRSPGIR
ncbi:Heparinase II/III-like protein [Opitutaceae bacterium TAV1]|nr:Heparinase II/III-like protein [Opitutaceae bacterium TAV1]